MRFLPEHREPKVAIVGLGYVGSCFAAILADHGCEVIGVDNDARLVDELTARHCRYHEEGLADLLFSSMAAGRLRVTTDYAALTAADVVIIAVGTPVRADGSLVDGQLRGACTEVSRHLRAGQLVVLKSTVPPGTTRELVLPLLERGGLVQGDDFGLAFTPERFAEGTALRELRKLPIVVGGMDDDSTEAAAAFWRRTFEVEVVPLPSPESAEIVKLADNWWIDLNIALANELAKFCALFEVDVLDVIGAANTVPKGAGKVNILLPSVGVGGSCLVKDPWMVWRSARERGLEILTAPIGREVNAGMPEYTAQLIAEELQRLGKDPAKSTVAVLGLAFKSDTGDLRATPVEAAVNALRKAGAKVRLYDPLVDPVQAEELFDLKPVATLREAVEGADCLALMTLHQQFREIDFAALPVSPSCLVLDGRAYYPEAKITSLRELGYVYRGIGR
ncbi:UDP-N-acetyl-D-mannosaminuronic acid dehydrogenase [Sphaerisporangium krabiense]|uniref:UDP-N-acetyl-D-mannosaminuronic acid dehydrogenase n=1 Tax=Sphaerisporangium krabiense TaxID=763782 RepID=A0A7W9DT27_9ACTN|nr:nucleotide sugar dehydrogenase [Sphaerisporangium krabiense]MBB5630188.1 UDP-N-acetyl-D-mannosaminuronic acid dehydrogenase [Sphaerisporangium krabiense]GII65139.1 UDP-N-acetyl-D-mannosaminuronic acid dehydrogenase [Sphaerisporangium krabiense]